jgi:hypothetical protein
MKAWKKCLHFPKKGGASPHQPDSENPYPSTALPRDLQAVGDYGDVAKKCTFTLSKAQP